MKTTCRRAVFLDRDGTINVDVDYLSRPQDVRLIAGAAQAVARLNQAGLYVVVVSNQSGLARGYFQPHDLQAVQEEIIRQLAGQGGKVDAWYHCPHLPGAVVPHLAKVCGCRKPAPGMVLRAAREHGLSLAGSFMVGDRLRDVACGHNAGLFSILVRSGQDDGPGLSPEQVPDRVARDLAQAVDMILETLEDEPIP